MYYFDEVAYRVACAKKRLRTLKAQAQACQLSESYLGQITRGAVPPEETRTKIAQALGTSVGELWKPLAVAVA